MGMSGVCSSKKFSDPFISKELFFFFKCGGFNVMFVDKSVGCVACGTSTRKN